MGIIIVVIFSSSSSAGGASNKRGRVNSSIDFLLTACNNQIETLAKRIINQCEGLSVDDVNEWRERVVQLSKDSASLSNALQVTNRVMESISKEHLRPLSLLRRQVQAEQIVWHQLPEISTIKL